MGQVHLDHADARIVQIDDLVLVDWRVVTAPHVHRVGDVVRASHLAHPTGVGLAMIIRRECPVPTAEVRASIKTTIAGIADNIRAHATVIEGEGIGASTVRASINAMRAVIRQRYPERTFATIDQALPWLAQHVAPGRAPRWSAVSVAGALAR